MAETAFLLAVLLALAAPLVLYALVRDERERDRETVGDWTDAEHVARRDDATDDGTVDRAHDETVDRTHDGTLGETDGAAGETKGNGWDRRD